MTASRGRRKGRAALLTAVALLATSWRAAGDETPPRTEVAGRLAGLVTAGALSLGATVTGAGILAGSWPEYQALDTQCGGRCPYPVVTPLEQRVTAGFALTAIGGVALLLDAVALCLDLRATRRARSLTVLPTAAGVVISGTFP